MKTKSDVQTRLGRAVRRRDENATTTENARQTDPLGVDDRSKTTKTILVVFFRIGPLPMTHDLF